MQFIETLHPDYCQLFTVDKVLYRKTTEHQNLVIFENAIFGRVLALDGVIQTTERDDHVYHEMLAHVPILAHGEASDVLIVGGKIAEAQATAEGAPFDEEGLLRLLRLARIGCDRIFAAQADAVRA